MKSLTDRFSYIKNFQSITTDYWLMLLFIFFMKAGQFMILPFLALHLNTSTLASAGLIGIAVGSGPLAYGLMGPFNGYFIDHFGAQKIIMFSMIVGGVLFIFFNAHQTISYYVLVNTLVGITRSAFDTATKSYKLHTMTPEFRRFSFSLRFTVLNTAASVGPLIGVHFIQGSANILFLTIGIGYIILSLFVPWIIEKESLPIDYKRPSLKQVFTIISTDSRLRYIVFASALMWGCYAQLDATLPLHLNHMLTNGIKIFMWTVVINTAGCALLQILMAKIMNSVLETYQVVLGCMFFMAGFFLFSVTLKIPSLFLAAFLIVLGEIIICPLMELLIYKIAPKEMINIYYGALAISIVGVGLGPIIGGFIYQHFKYTTLFLLCVISFLAIGKLLFSVIRDTKPYEITR